MARTQPSATCQLWGFWGKTQAASCAFGTCGANRPMRPESERSAVGRALIVAMKPVNINRWSQGGQEGRCDDVQIKET
jgi:hypothetical protein